VLTALVVGILQRLWRCQTIAFGGALAAAGIRLSSSSAAPMRALRVRAARRLRMHVSFMLSPVIPRAGAA